MSDDLILPSANTIVNEIIRFLRLNGASSIQTVMEALDLWGYSEDEIIRMIERHTGRIKIGSAFLSMKPFSGTHFVERVHG